MIVVHEGLPRSGKSYEAVVRRIIPALQASRVVWTNIEGVDHARIAEAAELPPEKVTELLHVLTPGQQQELWKCDLKNCLLVLDEVQNTWGVKAKLSPDMVKFVAEHGHHGIDVILMTQDIKDIHVIWRRRVEVRQVTMKLTAIGKSNSYSVTTYRGKGSELYEKVGTKVVKYDPRYFGTYKSYSDSDVSTAVLVDDRASVWGTALFRQVIPFVFMAGLGGAWFMWDFFNPEPGEEVVHMPARPAASGAPAASPSPVPVAAPALAPNPAAADRMRSMVQLQAMEDYPATPMLEKLAENTRPRLAAVLYRPGASDGVVEWVTEGGAVQQRLTFRQLRDMGVVVTLRGDAGALLRSDRSAWFATAYPVQDPAGQASQLTLNAVGAAGASGAGPAVTGGRPSMDARADIKMISETTARQPLPHFR